MNGIVTLARDEHGIVTPVDAWDRNPMVLNTPAGAFQLERGQPLSSGDLYTKVTGVAPDFQMKTPAFDRFLAEIFDNDIEMVAFLQRLMGYGLTGNRREQKIFFMYGVGANGENVLEGVLRAIAGTYAIVLPVEMLIVQKNPGHPTELAQLQGVRPAVSSEVPKHARWDKARLKSLTVDSMLRAGFMRSDFFEFPLTHKRLVLWNCQPRMFGGDAAMRRRIVLIPFTQQFSGTRCDPLLPTKMQAEFPGILARAITGAAKWARDGLPIPGAVCEASREYAEEQDDIGQWVADQCIEIANAWEPSRTLYESFADWKRVAGEQAPAQRAWTDQMKLRYRLHRRDTGRGFLARTDALIVPALIAAVAVNVVTRLVLRRLPPAPPAARAAQRLRTWRSGTLWRGRTQNG